jgi:hypothetical protein
MTFLKTETFGSSNVKMESKKNQRICRCTNNTANNRALNGYIIVHVVDPFKDKG